MNIHDTKKRERIYTHNKTILDKEKFISMLPGWNKKKFNKILESLTQKEVIEIKGDVVKIFLLPTSEKGYKNVTNNETILESHFTDDESELLILLSTQSTVSY
ncbi:MAG: hypothetical protein M1480_06260 [Bacteroidetes bacterium]|nr:hypothetical protein [Bacteroidota bacterium]